MKKLFILASLMLFFATPLLFGQTTTSENTQKIKKINFLAENINSLKKQISQTSDKKEAEALRAKLRDVEADFDELATDSDIFTEDDEATLEKRDVGAELAEVLRPVIQSLKRASQKPRKIEQLRNDIDDLEEKIKEAKHGLTKINDLMNNPDAAKIKEQLKDSQARTAHLAQNMMSEVTVFKDQLKEELKDDKSFWYASRELVGDFFKTKGRNLFYALFTVLFVFGALLLLKKGVISPIFSREKFYLIGRPIMALYGVFAVLFSIASGLICLFLLNDWFLFIVVLLIIAAIFWGFKHLIANLMEAIRVVFDLGTVREGQRVIFNGCPWKVKSVGVRTVLVNEALQGGEVGLNISKIKELTSRPVVKDEPWFPTKQGDYVMLSDGTYGRVNVQTPEGVILILPGDTKKYYSILDFLAQKPQNISDGFYLTSSISLDYSVQNKIHDMAKLFRTGLVLRLREHKLGSKVQRKGLEVQFSEAGDSSLNVFVGVKFKGQMAPYYFELKREINAMLVDICNELKLTIPYKQLVVHVSR